MQPSSRTPEGEFNRCPVCGKPVVLSPSKPAGDAPCPHCGVLLWFVNTPDGTWWTDDTALRLEYSVHETEPIDPSVMPLGGPFLKCGDRVKILNGPFAALEGEVATPDSVAAAVQVVIEAFGRSTTVKIEKRHLELV